MYQQTHKKSLKQARTGILIGLLLLAGCSYQSQYLKDQAEVIYAGTTIVNSDEANLVETGVTLSGYSHATKAADSDKARAEALHMIYGEAKDLYQGIRFRRQQNKQIEWLQEPLGAWVPSTNLEVLDLGQLGGTDLYRMQAVARLPGDFQKTLAQWPPIAAVGNSEVTKGMDLIEARRKARDAALQQGVERMVWYQYASKVPGDLTGTVFVEKYFKDPLIELLPQESWHGSMQLILKLRIRLDNPTT